MIDEVDKLGSDFRGDPSSALLEVLDPEQNATFRDHYLGVPYDLSRVLFITTANLLDPIQPAFRDRMEVIPIEGYSEDEKVTIVRRHLLPRLLHDHGLEPLLLGTSDEVLRSVIRGYTREAGLRNLERELAALCRKAARRRAEGDRRPLRVTPAGLARLLGPPRAQALELVPRDRVGIAAALAWTAAGGEVLLVEALVMAGKGELILTGQLGSVMQESARAALSYLRARAGTLGIDPARLGASDLHVHVPEGAIAKDGPSAGVAMAAAMCSALTGRRLRRAVAMSGEITLRGQVLPVGGLKEKLLAARRAGVRSVLLPRANVRDVEHLQRAVLGGMRVHLVDEVEEALRLALAGG